MRLGNWLLAAALTASGSCIADNPRNCVLSTNACGQNERCNQETQRCEPLDCTANTNICTASEYCDGLSKRCLARNCVRDPSLCTETQDCNMTTQLCQTRTFVLGQPDELTNLNAAYGMWNPQGVLMVADPSSPGKTKLFVADTSNNRVLIWNDLPTTNQPADVVLGAPDVNTLLGGNPYGGVNERSLLSPWQLASDGKTLIVADQALHRVLIWNPIPTQPSGAEPIPATQIWGQSNFETAAPNAGSDTPIAFGLNVPGAYLFHTAAGMTGAFYAPDRTNNRVLYFDILPLLPSILPKFVVGQVNAASNLGETSDKGLREPRSVAIDSNRMYVADTKNHRIMIFNHPPTADGQTAVGVLGQGVVPVTNFTTATPNAFGLSASSLASPTFVSIPVTSNATKHLFVADAGNHRVLRYTLPISSGGPADLVFGQANSMANLANRGVMPTAGSLNLPQAVSSDDIHVAIADFGNHRVLLWNNMPTTDGAAADVVLGQPGPSSVTTNTPPAGSPIPFTQPLHVETDGTRLAVADTFNHRVLIWNKIPKNGATPPDVVVGQDDLNGKQVNAGNGTPSAQSLNLPQGVFFDGDRMIIADTGNNRVLLYDRIPTSNNPAATYVVGKAAFNVQPPRPAGSYGVNQPTEAIIANGVLYVADFGNHRVLGYKTPWAMDPIPDFALGQPNTMLAGANYGGQSAKTLNNPRSVRVYEGKLLVADRSNHRVLIWNTLPDTNMKDADVVVGQTGFGASYTRTDRAQLSLPRNVMVQGGRLYVSSQNQNRILYWNEIPTRNGQRADGVLGQTDFLSTYPNNPDVDSIEKLSSPAGMAAFADQLFIADSLNNRLVVRAAP